MHGRIGDLERRGLKEDDRVYSILAYTEGLWTDIGKPVFQATDTRACDPKTTKL